MIPEPYPAIPLVQSNPKPYTRHASFPNGADPAFSKMGEAIVRSRLNTEYQTPTLFILGYFPDRQAE